MLGKILSSSVKTNTQAGNPRYGMGYIDAVDVAGNKVHRYVLDGSKDIAFAPRKMTAWGQPMNTDPGSVKPRGGLTNQIKGSVRYGQDYKVVDRGGLQGHLYANGKFVPMRKR